MSTQARNTGTLNTQGKSNLTLTWNQATFDWNDAGGIWDDPFALSPQTRNTGTLTPQTRHQ